MYLYLDFYGWFFHISSCTKNISVNTYKYKYQ